MSKKKMLGIVLVGLVGWGASHAAIAEDTSILVQSTTSTANSGLFDHILPIFEKSAGVKVRVVPVGTGQAIKNAQNCDADVLLVHAKAAEEKFVAEGYGVKRFDLMYNDFVIIGPVSDPAGVAGSNDALASMTKIAAASVPFASRGDDSGTHKKEVSLWKAAGVDIKAASGGWYRETGSGMGATLNVAAGMGAYALTDLATWLSFKNKEGLKITVEGDKGLFNQYGVILVNGQKCPSVKVEPGQKFVDWLIGADGQKAIASYQLNGEPLFFPNATGTQTN